MDGAMNMDPRSLQMFMEARFDAIERRMDDATDTSLRMHDENKAELREIKAEVKHTNGRLIVAEQHIKTLFKTLAPLAGAVRQRDLTWWGTVLAAGFGACYWLLTLMGWSRP